MIDVITFVLDYIAIPLICVLYLQDRRITRLEASQIKTADLEKIYKKIDELKDSSHNDIKEILRIKKG